jgi:MSHA biogenesis protein MshQ
MSTNFLRPAVLAAAMLYCAAAWAPLNEATVSLAPTSIAGAGTTTLTIALRNQPPPGGAISNVAFNYAYPGNVLNAAAPAVANGCGGTVSAAALGNSISLSGGSVGNNSTCEIDVTLQSCVQGTYSIGGFNVTASSGGATANSVNLTVTSNSPAIASTSTVTANPGSVPADGATASTITVTALNVCGTGAPGKTVTLAAGSGSSVITPASAVTDASGVATFSVTNGIPETVTYTATVVTDGVGAITQTASVTFTALSAPLVAKSFSPNPIDAGQSSTLTVTITNPNIGTITGLAFTDTYPAGLLNSATPALSNSCGGTAGATGGGNQLTLTGVALAGGANCSVGVSVTAAAAGSYLNSTGLVTSNNAVAGTAASATLTVNPGVVVASFNVVEPAADPVSGRIFTKIAGQNIAVDIVALDAGNNVATAFTGDVGVALVDNSGGGACAALPLVKTLATQTFVPADNGRHALSAGQFEANAYRNLGFRVTYPVGAPTVTACSGDAFANRPLRFVNLLARDADRTSAGTTRTLDNTASPGTGTVHNAGRPFRIDATAQNGAGAPATTTLYAPDAGQPVALVTQCGVAAVCPAALGTLTPGAWSAAAGVITATTATYGEVGAFDLYLEDRTFASVDAGDGTSTAVRYIPSAVAITVGRFVPDHFTLEAGSSITPRSDIGACAGSIFTYMDERMDLAFTLTAREAGGAATPGYAGATLGALALNDPAAYQFGAIDAAAPTPLSARLDTALVSGVANTWAAGTTGAITAPVSLSRGASPDGPYGQLRIGIAPTDPDGVALRSADFDLDADDSGSAERIQVGAATQARFGRLRLQNAYGSDSVALPVPIETQYWDGTTFVTNGDDDCTSLAAANISLSDYAAGLDPGETSIVEATLAFSAGRGTLTLTPPGAGNAGSVLVTPDLAAAGLLYLQGAWSGAAWDDNPSGQAAFGLYGSQPKNFIFFRENY